MEKMDEGLNLYELLGRPRPAGEGAPPLHAPFAWDDADGDGPDRLFNRYRRLRLDARADAGLTPPRCPAAPSAARA